MFEDKITPKDYKGISLIKNETEEYSPGRDFLTWLWYFSEEEGGEVNVKGYEKFAMMIDVH